ncbi:MAG: MarR family winged helix-turn-helix transcriptional regulator [Desulfopila sp.]
MRQIIQTIDQHSIALKKRFGLTGPQLIVLQAVSANAPISVKSIASIVSLGQATVTDITKRLEKSGYLTRAKNTSDRRKTAIVLTEQGNHVLDEVPPLLQEQFTSRFSELETWEQLMIESAFERVVKLMSVDEAELSPSMIRGAVAPEDA